MTGQKFADDDEGKKVVPKWLCTPPKIFNSDTFQKPVDQWANCIEKQGDYV
jgi:hypothetical protein